MSDSTDPIDAYNTALRLLEDVETEVNTLVRDICSSAPPDVAGSLKEWRSLLIGDMRPPSTVMSGPGFPDSWTSIAEDECDGLAPLKAALVRWRDAWAALDEAWHFLPPAQKSIVRRPH